MITTLIVAQAILTRTISVYGYPGDGCGNGTASGQKFDPNKLACAVPFKWVKGKRVMEIPMGSILHFESGKYSADAEVNDVCNGRYWSKRVDSTPALYKALHGPKSWGLIHDVKVTIIRRGYGTSRRHRR